jgi:uncharacterized protein YndB with AHSA1/START domain
MNEYGERIDKTTVRFERLLPGPVERVWEFIVDPDKRQTWFCSGAFDLKPGGVAQFHFDHRRLTDEKPPKKYENHGGEIKFEGTIVEAKPPRLLVFDWPEDDGANTRVTIELAPSGDKVKLTLTHSLLEKRETMLSVSGGWHLHLDMLENALNDGKGGPFWSRVEKLESEYEERHGA